jgi:hypothetical protein
MIRKTETHRTLSDDAESRWETDGGHVHGRGDASSASMPPAIRWGGSSPLPASRAEDSVVVMPR